MARRSTDGVVLSLGKQGNSLDAGWTMESLLR
jgi:hypothetical protein